MALLALLSCCTSWLHLSDIHQQPATCSICDLSSTKAAETKAAAKAPAAEVPRTIAAAALLTSAAPWLILGVKRTWTATNVEVE